jgi:hypothetical protein
MSATGLRASHLGDKTDQITERADELLDERRPEVMIADDVMPAQIERGEGVCPGVS